MNTSRITSLLGWALALTLFASQLLLFRTFFIDDAFITFRYVRQFVAGNGLVYNIGERVEGYSNFLWVMLLALPHALGAELITTARVLSTALSIGSLLLTYHLARSAPYPILAPIMLAAAGPFGAWTMGGLETSLFAFLLTASVAVFIHEEERGRGALSGVLFGLLALARPEGVIFFALAVAFRAWRLLSGSWTGLARLERRDWLRVAGFVGLFLPHFLWRLSYYGYPLPNTVYAKSMGLHPRAFIEGVYYLFDGLTALGGPLLLLLPAGILLFQSQELRYRFISACCGAYLLFSVVGGGDWMPMHRFWVHILPLLIVLVHAGLMKLAALIAPRWAWLTRTGFALAQTAFLYFGVLHAVFVVGIGRVYAPLPYNPLLVAYVRQHWQPGDVIAVSDAGEIAYALPLEARVVDMFGLADAHIAHLTPQFPSGLLGHGDVFGKWDVDYVLAQNPRFVQVHILGQKENGEFIAQHTAERLLVNDPRFRARYRQVSDKPELSGLFERIP
jgi:arabinofuranosyltransferase